MRFAILIWGAVFLTATSASAAGADLEQALDRLSAAAEEETQLSPEFRDALSGVIVALRARSTETAGDVAAPNPAAPLWERIHAFGDMRLRQEHDANRPGLDNRNRTRVRLRVGAEVDLHPEVAAGFRVRTGDPDDPNSPHQTLNNMFDSYQFELDRAYMRYQPAWAPGARALAGKFGSPFVPNPVYGELVWDADVNPEGIALAYKTQRENLAGNLALGQYVLVEQNDGNDASLFAIQGGGKLAWGKGWSARADLAWYRYANLNASGSTASLADNAGNAVVDTNGDGMPDRYASDFHIWNPILSLAYAGGEIPLTLSGEYIYNSEAEGSDDKGFAVGTSIGQVSVPGDWKIFYQWQRIEQEAVFTPFVQDDFLLATNFRGHVFGADYRLTERIGLRAWGLIARALRTLDDDEQIRLRFDVNARF